MGTGPTVFPLYTEKRNLKGWEHCAKKKKKKNKSNSCTSSGANI